MKRYKLIKEYPGSPELGKVLSKSDTFKAAYYIAPELIVVENEPEFWEEIVEPGYVIISVINPKNTILTYDGETCIKRSDGIGAEATVSLQRALSNFYGCKIRSIKRTKDGKIFTIGDKVKNPAGLTFNISEFYTDCNDEHLLCNGEYTGNGHININKIEHSTPIFRTYDGFDVYPGDKTFGIDKNSLLPLGLNHMVWSDNEIPHSEHLHFSTKEKADEYIIMNKPCLSINDIETPAVNLGEYVREELKKLVKSRL